jgi:hypothetical protein
MGQTSKNSAKRPLFRNCPVPEQSFLTGRQVLCNILFKLFKLEVVHMVGEEPPAPRPAVNPGYDLLYDRYDLVLFFEHDQIPAEVRVPPPPPPDKEKVMRVVCLYGIERAGTDTDPALDAFFGIEDTDSVFYLDRILLAVLDTRPATGA